MIDVDESLCPKNHACPCVPKCPVDAISQDGLGAPEIDLKKCTGCKICVRICPTGAINEK